jgi:hypothetical protein
MDHPNQPLGYRTRMIEMLTKGINRNKGSHATEPTLKPHLSLIAHEVTTSQSSGLVRRSTPESPFCTFLSESTERALTSPLLPSHPFTSETAYMTPFWSYLQNSTQGAKISQASHIGLLMKVRENKCFSLSPSRAGAGAGAQAQAVGMKHPSQARASDPLPVCHLCHADEPPSRARRMLRVTPQVRASDPLPVCYLHHPEGLPRAFIPTTLALDR